MQKYTKIQFKFKMGKKKSVSVPKKPTQEASKNQDARLSKQKQKRKLFSKIYREYSRRKYNKYRLQFPKLKESDIINKIIKQWEALTDENKLSLQKSFIQTGGADFLKDDSKSKSKSKSKSSSSKSKPKQEDGQAKLQQGKQEEGAEEKPKKKKKPSPKVRIFVEKATDKNRDYKEDSDYKKDGDTPNKGGKGTPQGSSGSAQLIIKGKKKIIKKETKQKKSEQVLKKGKVSQYLTFYRYYYNRLITEHPRWSSNEVTTIIKLLWKKRSMKTKSQSLPKKLRNLKMKPVSGRVMYRKEKEGSGLSAEQIYALWKLLPHQSKKFWQKKGRGGTPLIKKSPNQSISQLKKVMKSGSQEKKPGSNLKWMDTLIRSS